MLDDAQLLRSYAEDHSEAAFAELVRRYIDLVYSAALRQVDGDTHRAQDVSQIVFTTLARKAASLIHHPALAGWFYTATYLAATKVMRAEWRRLAREKEAHAMHEALSPNSPEIDWQQVRPVLDAAMRDLNDRDREAVLLRFFAKRPFAEIGATLGLSEDAARMCVERALAKLHGLLARRGVTSTSAALGGLLATQAVSAAPAGLPALVCQTVFAQIAAVSGGTAGTLLTFMSTQKFAAIIAATLTVLAVGTATRQVFASAAAANALAATHREADVLSLRQRELAQRVQAVEQSRDELQRSLDAMRATQAAEQSRAAAAPTNPPASRTTVPTAEQLAEGEAFLLRHPEFKQALLDRSRARIDARFRPLYRSLNLTPAQIERFQQLMMEGEGTILGNPGLKGPLIVRPGTGMSREEVEASVRNLLGDSGYQSYQEASRLIGPRQVALDLAGALYFTATPLTTDQADRLSRLVDATQTENAKARRNRRDYWNALLAKSRGILSEPQVSALAGFQQQEEFQRELQRVQSSWALPGWQRNKTSPSK
jgi:RNA polymerase sigma factor (sigma-70 family)